jgi:hypothetical protein
VITPRLAILIAPGAAELLLSLAESDGPGDDAAGRRRTARLERAAVLLAVHARLRPHAVGPLEARDNDRIQERVGELLGPEALAAAQAEGGGLSAEEAAALMRDVD